MTIDVMRTLDSWPEAWIAEGFRMTLRMVLSRLKTRIREILIVCKLPFDKAKHRGPELFRKKWYATFKADRTALMDNFRSLTLLKDELAALRHLRVHRYPSRDLEKEIIRERALYVKFPKSKGESKGVGV
jgi:hypothetical protein